MNLEHDSLLDTVIILGPAPSLLISSNRSLGTSFLDTNVGCNAESLACSFCDKVVPSDSLHENLILLINEVTVVNT